MPGLRHSMKMDKAKQEAILFIITVVVFGVSLVLVGVVTWRAFSCG